LEEALPSKADKEGEITIEGVITPDLAEGVYEIINL
jgi:hypothetical protein